MFGALGRLLNSNEEYTTRDGKMVRILCNGGGGGSRTPVRKALRPEDYMLSSIPFVSPGSLRMSKKRDRLARLVLAVAFRTET